MRDKELREFREFREFKTYDFYMGLLDMTFKFKEVYDF